MDRQSIIECQQQPLHIEGEQLYGGGSGRGGAGEVEEFKVMEFSSSPKKHRGVSHPLSQVGYSRATYTLPVEGVIFKGCIHVYSETCANGHLYSETTCIKRPLRDVPKVSV